MDLVRSFKITLLSDSNSWINAYLPNLVQVLKRDGHRVEWVFVAEAISAGDFAFFLGRSKIVPPKILSRNKHNLVVHESALPQGRGWSPLTWQVLEGKSMIPVRLFEAIPKVDSGRIYLRDELRFEGTELIDKIRKAVAASTIRLCVEFVKKYPDVLDEASEQIGKPTFYRKRVPEDSRLDPNKTIRDQFNLLRVVDNDHYPAFFEIQGQTYILKIERRE